MLFLTPEALQREIISWLTKAQLSQLLDPLPGHVLIQMTQSLIYTAVQTSFTVQSPSSSSPQPKKRTWHMLDDDDGDEGNQEPRSSHLRNDEPRSTRKDSTITTEEPTKTIKASTNATEEPIDKKTAEASLTPTRTSVANLNSTTDPPLKELQQSYPRLRISYLYELSRTPIVMSSHLLRVSEQLFGMQRRHVLQALDILQGISLLLKFTLPIVGSTSYLLAFAPLYFSFLKLRLPNSIQQSTRKASHEGSPTHSEDRNVPDSKTVIAFVNWLDSYVRTHHTTALGGHKTFKSLLKGHKVVFPKYYDALERICFNEGVMRSEKGGLVLTLPDMGSISQSLRQGSSWIVQTLKLARRQQSSAVMMRKFLQSNLPKTTKEIPFHWILIYCEAERLIRIDGLHSSQETVSLLT